MGKKIKFLGSKQMPVYHGLDHGAGEAISLQRGEEREVSDAKAGQVADDFPHLFLVDGKKPAAPKQAAAPVDDEPEDETEPDDETDETSDDGAEGDDPKAELLALSLEDLTARATKLGIDGAGKGKLKTKAQLADAILAKLAETTSEAS